MGRISRSLGKEAIGMLIKSLKSNVKASPVGFLIANGLKPRYRWIPKMMTFTTPHEHEMRRSLMYLHFSFPVPSPMGSWIGPQ